MTHTPAPELSPAEAARVAVFDAAPTPPEVVAETVARAIGEEWCTPLPWDELSLATQNECRRLATAAIAVLPPSPAEEAVKRVEALLPRIEAVMEFDMAGERYDAVTSVQQVLEHLRAALASPATEGVDRYGCPDGDHLPVDCPGDACRFAKLRCTAIGCRAPATVLGTYDDGSYQQQGVPYCTVCAALVGDDFLPVRSLLPAAALASPAPAPHGEHRMLPGSHERRGGPECRCGANWDRWNDRCTASSAPAPQGEEGQR